jgi:glycerol-3-phosphate dehydrogenase
LPRHGLEAIVSPVKDDLLPLPVARRASLGRGRRACVIGGGGTGAALAYDLALRGLSVVLLERGELTSGTTGRHHGQLHSGARYAWADRAIARECYEETLILRRIVPEAIEYNGGYFIALTDYEADLVPDFLAACAGAGIPSREVPRERALSLEPGMNPALKRVVEVPDGSFDAFRLPLAFFAAAAALGADIRPWREVSGLVVEGGRVTAARVIDRGSASIREERVEADYFISATGAWSGSLAAMAGIDVPITPAPGTMVAVRGRFVDRVVSRLRHPSDGDIVVPQRGLSIIGSTQRVTDDPDSLLPPREEVARLLADGAALVPAFSSAPLHAAWSAARPLAGRSGGDEGRSISRDFAVLDHEERDGIKGLATVIGGKATVLRAMAAKAADLACSRLGVAAACETDRYALPSWRGYYAGRP